MASYTCKRKNGWKKVHREREKWWNGALWAIWLTTFWKRADYDVWACVETLGRRTGFAWARHITLGFTTVHLWWTRQVIMRMVTTITDTTRVWLWLPEYEIQFMNLQGEINFREGGLSIFSLLLFNLGFFSHDKWIFWLKITAFLGRHLSPAKLRVNEAVWLGGPVFHTVSHNRPRMRGWRAIYPIAGEIFAGDSAARVTEAREIIKHELYKKSWGKKKP